MKSTVRAKKHLGQHFLTDSNIARNIASLFTGCGEFSDLIEIGPGTGMLTQFLLEKPCRLYLLEIDHESIQYLMKFFSAHPNVNIVHQDFLTYPIDTLHEGQVGIIGNFPYNISSQIFFHLLKYHHRVKEVVCMLQKEVAERLASPPGTRDYGILSVLLQTFYDIEYAFSVPPKVFYPPPKVDSGVIRLSRRDRPPLTCSFDWLQKVVKVAFNQRRKMLRNTLYKFISKPDLLPHELLERRPEQLSHQEFETLATIISQQVLP